ncbi:SDR family NAD(P)-dependent oxidoreductase [Chachezhania antarctica]|uniref:SDR family NAD(P)-dependent oxidoreductase n=1 Tax=Chachezhania antarctica TaxID=2340860 RepID=UPI000EB50221|nr:glucose 1-dehydrogenase [Chachezhania antarctica]|tara:strand:+ start:2082 stop:2888 length:807 start_codon:yes stop_codon:yes gene_type:complete
MFNLKGKTVVVTGGGRGIGRGISVAMAAAGANVVCSGRNAAPLEETVAEIEAAGGRAVAVPADITDMATPPLLVARAQEAFGSMDTWVNNAGSAARGDVGALIDIDEGQWDRVVDLNMKSAFFAAQAAARAMRDQGRGSIINITSRSGSHPNPMTGQYGAAKAGVENLTMTMAVEWGHMGIRVNAVAPGVVVTEETSAVLSGDRAQKQIDSVPMGRLGQPHDIASACVYLASDEAEWVSGITIPVNGGSRIAIGHLAYMRRVAKNRGA